MSLKSAGMYERWMLIFGVTVLHIDWLCDTQLKNLLFWVIWQSVSTLRAKPALWRDPPRARLL